MNQFNGNLIVSGLLALSKEGYRTTEQLCARFARRRYGTVMKLHAYFRQNQLPYTRIRARKRYAGLKCDFSQKYFSPSEGGGMLD
ncbi:hypothetical protein [Dubosiella newyorkensis]|uniref:hypothetical protein n=1 Tax=Dubosiella newyorkensis TaxID=1862672 RepID=UPI003F66BFE1